MEILEQDAYISPSINHNRLLGSVVHIPADVKKYSEAMA